MQNRTSQGAEGHSSAFSSLTQRVITLNGHEITLNLSNPAEVIFLCLFLGSTALRPELVRFYRASRAFYKPMQAFLRDRPFAFLVGSIWHPFLVPSLPPMFRGYVEEIHKDQAAAALEAILTDEGREMLSAYVGLILRSMQAARALVPEALPEHTEMEKQLLALTVSALENTDSQALSELVRDVFYEHGLDLVGYWNGPEN